jgi:hypothetical protein
MLASMVVGHGPALARTDVAPGREDASDASPNPPGDAADDSTQAPAESSVPFAPEESASVAEPVKMAPAEPPSPGDADDDGVAGICEIDPAACPKPFGDADRPVHKVTPLLSQASMGGVSSKAFEQFVMPSGYAEVSGELVLVTAEAALAFGELDLTDLALFNVHGRRSFGDDVELRIGTTLLPKQPSGTSELVWQGALVGATYEIEPGYAVTLTASGGPLLDGAGSFWQATPGFVAKWSLDDDARLLLGVANVFTALDSEVGVSPRAWVEEVSVSSEAQLGKRDGALWLAVGYSVPLASSGDLPGAATTLELDPAVRLSLEVGGALTFKKTWDLFATYSVVDHGEADNPASMLPILDGGFDQRQIVFGVQHRFVPEPKEHEPERHWW